MLLPPYTSLPVHSPGSDRYNCINSRQNSLFAVVCDILKIRCERYEDQWWTGDVVQQLANMSIHASNCCKTWLLRNKIQTCLKIVKLLHKQSNHPIHDQTVCATACVVQIVWPCMGPLRFMSSQAGLMCTACRSFDSPALDDRNKQELRWTIDFNP